MGAADEWRTRLRSALTVAMKARDTDAVAALRGAIAAIDNAEAVDPPDAANAASTSAIASSPWFSAMYLSKAASVTSRICARSSGESAVIVILPARPARPRSEASMIREIPRAAFSQDWAAVWIRFFWSSVRSS